MKVPLMVYQKNTDMVVVRNGSSEHIEYPFKPYCVVKKDFYQIPPSQTPYFVTDIKSHTPIEVYKKDDFDSIMERDAFYRQNRKSGQVMWFPAIEQVLIDRRDFFLQYPHDREVQTFVLDIETRAKGRGSFSKPEHDPIISIAYKINDEPTQILMNYDEVVRDRFICEEFLNVFAAANPDVVVGYNHWNTNGSDGFDMQYIIKRCQKHKLDLRKLCRWPVLPFRENHKGEMEYHIFGRSMFDVWNFTRADQTLTGNVKNFKLKTVGKYFGVDMIEVPMNDGNEYLINTMELKDYNTSDVNGTHYLFKNIYFNLRKELAEMMGIPFDMATNSYKSFIPKIFLGRQAHKTNMVGFERNVDRYENVEFEAASVKISKPGFHKDLWKADMTGFYPSIMMTFNLGVETTKFIKYEDLTDIIKLEKIDNFLQFSVPDHTLNKNVVISINMSKNSLLKTEMMEFYNIRKKVRDELKKEIPETKKIELNSISQAIKVIQNSVYGISSQPTTTVTDLCVGIIIVGIARWIINDVCDRIFTDSLVELDTDGVFVDVKPDLQTLNNYVATLINKTCGIPIPDIKVEFAMDPHCSGYFHKAKNYVLKKDNGKFVYHGVSMKGSRMSKVYDEVIMSVSKMILNEASDSDIKRLVQAFYTMSQFELEDFLMRTKITKQDPLSIKESKKKNVDATTVYKNANALQPSLMRRFEDVYKKKAELGDSIEYYKTIRGYLLKDEVTSLNQIDFQYYRTVIDKAMGVFRLDKKTRFEKAQCKFDFY